MHSLARHIVKALASTLIAPALALSLVASAATAAAPGDDLSKGLDAYQARRFDEALKHFRRAAEQGDAEAQLHLGAMYFNGHGVTQDRDVAAHWFHEAAVHGNLEAQYVLGVIYWDGRGVAKDYMSAYMWFNIASRNGSKSAEESVGRIASNLTSGDISKAERRARACMDSNYQNCQ
jgi:TPR repeat protein